MGNISQMRKLLEKILSEVRHGFHHAMVMSRARPYEFPANRPFALDAANLRRDAKQVIRNLNAQFRKQDASENIPRQRK